MGNALADELESTIWTALYNKITAETNIGSTGPGSGTNPAGRLQTCADVRKSMHLWTTRVPAIGVQSRGYKEADYSTSSHLVTVQFYILVGAQSLKTSTQPANMDDANAKLQPLVSDGSGNGVGPILRDPKNYTLGVNGVLRSKINGVNRWGEVKEGGEPEVWSYAMFDYEVVATVAVK